MQTASFPARLSLLSLALLASWSALANPTGAQVARGQVSLAAQGNTLNITNSNGAIINWQGFSIAPNETTRFIQPDARSQVLNRVVGQDPSRLLGSLQSNGQVFLINPSGIVFGQGARIDVGGLVASSLHLSDSDFIAGRLNFDSGPLAAGIHNQGSITTPSGGRVYLIAPNVDNSGVIRSPQGDVLLAAGNKVRLMDSGAPFVSVEVTAPTGKALNLGEIVASGGRVGLQGALVEQAGVIRADGASRDAGGAIVFRSSAGTTLAACNVTSANGAQGGQITVESGTGRTLVSGQVEAKGTAGGGGAVQILGPEVGILNGAAVDVSGQTGGGTILAGGDAHGANPAVPNARATYFGEQASLRADALAYGDGGKIIVWSDEATRAYGALSARGGAGGGNGGFVETSGRFLQVTRAPDLAAPAGHGGTWLLDPNDLVIGGVSNQQLSGGPDYTTSDDSAVISVDTLQATLDAGINVTLETGSAGANSQAGNITVAAAITKAEGSDASLTLLAHNDIVFLPGSQIVANMGKLHLNLTADKDANGSGDIKAPDASVGTALIDLNSGNLAMRGANLLGTAFDIHAGDVSLTATQGDIVLGRMLQGLAVDLHAARDFSLTGTVGFGASAAQIQAQNVTLNARNVTLDAGTTSALIDIAPDALQGDIVINASGDVSLLGGGESGRAYLRATRNVAVTAATPGSTLRLTPGTGADADALILASNGSVSLIAGNCVNCTELTADPLLNGTTEAGIRAAGGMAISTPTLPPPVLPPQLIEPIVNQSDNTTNTAANGPTTTPPPSQPLPTKELTPTNGAPAGALVKDDAALWAAILKLDPDLAARVARGDAAALAEMARRMVIERILAGDADLNARLLAGDRVARAELEQRVADELARRAATNLRVDLPLAEQTLRDAAARKQLLDKLDQILTRGKPGDPDYDLALHIAQGDPTAFDELDRRLLAGRLLADDPRLRERLAQGDPAARYELDQRIANALQAYDDQATSQATRGEGFPVEPPTTEQVARLLAFASLPKPDLDATAYALQKQQALDDAFISPAFRQAMGDSQLLADTKARMLAANPNVFQGIADGLEIDALVRHKLAENQLLAENPSLRALLAHDPRTGRQLLAKAVMQRLDAWQLEQLLRIADQALHSSEGLAMITANDRVNLALYAQAMKLGIQLPDAVVQLLKKNPPPVDALAQRDLMLIEVQVKLDHPHWSYDQLQAETARIQHALSGALTQLAESKAAAQLATTKNQPDSGSVLSKNAGDALGNVDYFNNTLTAYSALYSGDVQNPEVMHRMALQMIASSNVSASDPQKSTLNIATAQVVAEAALTAYLQTQGGQNRKSDQNLLSDQKQVQQALEVLGKAKDSAFQARLAAGEPQAQEEVRREIFLLDVQRANPKLVQDAKDQAVTKGNKVKTAEVNLALLADLRYEAYQADQAALAAEAAKRGGPAQASQPMDVAKVISSPDQRAEVIRQDPTLAQRVSAGDLKALDEVDKRLVMNQLLAGNKDLKAAYELELKSGSMEHPVAAWLDQMAQAQLQSLADSQKSGVPPR